MKIDVLYEDNHIIAVHKPAGMLVQGDHSGDPTLIDEVRYFLKQKYNKPGNVFLGMVHRLDRPASGIVLFAKTSKGASRLSEQFRAHSIQKIYHVLVEVHESGVPQTQTLVHFLKKELNTNIVRVVDPHTPGALKAELEYTIVEQRKSLAIVKVNLKTGRPHQIRVQLSAVGMPIVGDVKYGGYATGSPEDHHSIALCASSVKFKLATKDEEVEISIPTPNEWKERLAAA